MSDNGREFVNEVYKGVTKIMKIDHFTIASYRSSANGLVESHNRKVTNILKHLVGDNPSQWVEMLPWAEFSLNTAYNGSNRDTAFFVVFVQEHVLPYTVDMDPHTLPLYNTKQYRVMMCNLDRKVFQLIKRYFLRANEKYQTRCDQSFQTPTSYVQIGDRIYLKMLQPRKHKLEASYVGPYCVNQIKTDTVVIQHIWIGAKGD
ncbi:uncharacterized protein [Palaemon carinicauda]|uniref:uncharacterized protein n=1 Tax=Palaemon carinicauda TaxID=392227 RepID=UPI0035B5719E